MQSLLKLVAKLTLSQFALLVIFFLAVLAPGYLLLATFKADWLARYDGTKLIVLALAAVGPLVFAAALVADLTVDYPSRKYLPHMMIMTATNLIASFYPAIVLTHFYHLNLWQFLNIIGAILVVQIGLAKIGYKRIRNL